MTGVCAVQMDATRYPASFQVHLRSPADIHVLRKASWWTARNALGVLGVMGAVILLTLAWLVALQKRVQAQTTLIERRLKRERALEMRYQDLFENATDLIPSLNPDATLAHGNRALFSTLGYTPEELLGRPLAVVLDPACTPRFEERFRRLLAGEALETVEADLIARDGRRVTVEGTWTCTQQDGQPVSIRGIFRDVTERKQAAQKLAAAHQHLLGVSRRAGMAEVATGVLHNVGNVLNSVNVSANLIAEWVRKSKLSGLNRATAMMREHDHELAAFLTQNPKGRQVPGYLIQLAEQLTGERQAILRELESLRRNLDHIKGIVAMQQGYARVSGVTETVSVAEIVEDAVRMNATGLNRQEVEVVRQFSESAAVAADKHKVLQILVNLIRNAEQACDDSGREDKRVVLGVRRKHESVLISVTDNGVGVPRESLTRIFNHGFTTRKDGHGFGLHSSALAAREMGGSLSVHSDGPGTGATFTLELPTPQS
jgi:PAS domain S-box-containing protein